MYQLLYRKARIAAPAARPIPAVAKAAPPVEVEVEEPVVEELESELELELELLEVEDLVEVPVAVVSELVVVRGVLLRTELVKLPVAGVTTGAVRPAGIEAAASWEVAAAGWLVTTEGWPVTTPRELVSVR